MRGPPRRTQRVIVTGVPIFHQVQGGHCFQLLTALKMKRVLVDGIAQ